MNKGIPRFSVFTATYNRADSLKELYSCLCRQTFKDFEWVVVSDGSTDHTDAIMSELIDEGILDIKYYPLSQNGGKHTAWREGLKHFIGEYVISADDDDPVTPDMLEIHNKYWSLLEKDPGYDKFWEVRSRCVDTNGNLIGKQLPSPWFDSDYIEVNIKMKNKAEMVGSRKLEILKREASIPPFIMEDKCSNFEERIRWIRAAKKYKTRFVPDVTRIYIPNPSGLINTKKTSRSLYNSLVGCGYYVRENRDILLKYDVKGYLVSLALIGYKAAQTKENISVFRLNKLDYILASSAKWIFKFYLMLSDNK